MSQPPSFKVNSRRPFYHLLLLVWRLMLPIGVTHALTPLLASPAGIPVIAVQPSNATVGVGANVVMSVSVTGDAPLTFQWRKDGQPIDGATSPTLLLTNVQATDGGGYYVVVSEATGSATSSVAVLTVSGPVTSSVPRILAQPASVTAAAGTNVVLSLGATGHLPLSYQWRKNGDPIDGATSPSLVLSNIQPSDAGGYYVVVSEFTGSVTSAVATLNLGTAPSAGSVPQIIVQPTNVVTALGMPATLTVVATGDLALTYQWRKDGQPIDGATGPTLTLPSVQNADVGIYYVVVSEATGSTTSNSVLVALAGVPRITLQPQNTAATAGTIVTLSVTATGDTALSYQWWKEGATIPGATNSTLVITNAQVADSGAYYVIVSETTGFVKSTTVTVTIASNTPIGVPQITAQPISVTIPAGSTGTLSVTATSDAALNYQWRKDGQPVDGATSRTLVLANAQPTDAGSYYVVVSQTTGSATSSTAIVTISAPLTPGVPRITTQPTSASSLVGGTITLSVTAIGDNTITYQWQKNSVAIPGATGSSLVLSNIQSADAGSYSVIVSEPTASVTSAVAQVVIVSVPKITAQPTSVTAALGTTATLAVTVTADAPVSYQWRKDGQPVDGATGSTLTLPNVRLADAGRYYVVVSQSTGSVTSATVVVTVGLPAGSALQPLSAGAAVTLQISPSITNDNSLNYRWQINGRVITSAFDRTLILPNLQPVDAGLYATEITGLDGKATSEPSIVGVLTTNKVIGTGTELAANVFSPSNGATFDQVLLSGAAATVTADPGQITRTSFIDLNDDIVQVELSGPGTLSVVLTDPTGPAVPVKYNQGINYMKGHAGLVIIGATKDTNLSVFSVGRITATNGALFNSTTTYDGVADIAFIAIASTDGKFGGVRTANASYFATQGMTGIYAPGVTFTGPVYVGDINASGAATPVLLLGGATDNTWITGGDLLQSNAQPVRVSGLAQLKFMAGQTSHGGLLPAQTNKAVLHQNGADVTTAIVVNPK